jgi:hypothetical protein
MHLSRRCATYQSNFKLDLLRCFSLTHAPVICVARNTEAALKIAGLMRCGITRRAKLVKIRLSGAAKRAGTQLRRQGSLSSRTSENRMLSRITKQDMVSPKVKKCESIGLLLCSHLHSDEPACAFERGTTEILTANSQKHIAGWLVQTHAVLFILTVRMVADRRRDTP